MTDRKRLYLISAFTLAALLIIFFLPFDTVGRVLAAFALAAAAAVAFVFLKKRSIPSINSRMVLLIMTMVALAFLMLYYLSGLELGFYRNPYAFNGQIFFTRVVATAVVIVASEVFRWVVRAQESKRGDVLCYLCCVLGEMLICSTADVAVSSFNHFMDLVAVTMFPALLANLLYHYLVKRYGPYPSMVYRLILALHMYVISVQPKLSDSLMAFVQLLIPLAIYLFIDALYERKRRYALAKKSKLSVPITVLAIAVMLVTVMTVSNHFRFGIYVIATPSMTGELNQGDAAIYERYDDQVIVEGQVIVFEKNDVVVIHRVADIEIINGKTRYYTKGDANDNMDAGFIYDSNIIGLVNWKIPYIGYPTLWMRSLFAR
ncbi:MAG: signal peptidase I [Clostridia bacterium]|nr:signal peptidase I [Clostridia bacterium]